MKQTDILIVGAGIAGISAAKAAAAYGVKVVIADREDGFGGVLRRCIHRGFGDGRTGPEYVQALSGEFPAQVQCCFSTTVLEIRKNKTAVLSSCDKGVFEIGFKGLILAAGCMEISPGMLPIGGTRPQNVFTAGEAQLMSCRGERFPEPVVVLGGGDLGLIMARQLKEQGHELACIIEKNPEPGAMARNRGILDSVPLITNSSISCLHGSDRLRALTVRNLISGEQIFLPCGTLLVAAGLRPDRSLARGIEDEPWLIYCGNCLKIYPMVEGLAADAEKTARDMCERNRQI